MAGWSQLFSPTNPQNPSQHSSQEVSTEGQNLGMHWKLPVVPSNWMFFFVAGETGNPERRSQLQSQLEASSGQQTSSFSAQYLCIHTSVAGGSQGIVGQKHLCFSGFLLSPLLPSSIECHGSSSADSLPLQGCTRSKSLCYFKVINSWTGMGWEQPVLIPFYNLGSKILERSGRFHFGNAGVSRHSPLQPSQLFPLAGHRKCQDQRQTGLSRLKVGNACLWWLWAVTWSSDFSAGWNFSVGRITVLWKEKESPRSSFPPGTLLAGSS